MVPRAWYLFNPGRLRRIRPGPSWLIYILLLVICGAARAAPIAPDDLFFAPSTMPTASYPHQSLAGDPQNGPWTAVWTTTDILALDPGRADVAIVGADVLPVLVSNPATADGEYSDADLAAINVTNYMAYYMQKPGLVPTAPATDYAADLTANVLTVTFKAPAMYAVRVETMSSATPGGPLESRGYIYTEFVNDFFAGDGSEDAQTPQRVGVMPDADIYIVSDGDPNDNGAMTNAAAQLTAQGKNVCRAKNLQEAKDCIKDLSKRLGRKVKVIMIGHGRPGSIKIGTERINGFADGVQTPADFQSEIDEYVEDIDFYSCNTAKGKDGRKFLQDFANSIGTAGGFINTVTFSPTYVDVQYDGKKAEDYGVCATEPVNSAPTTFNLGGRDLFYFGADDGFLYAQTTEGGVVPGFPVDTRRLLAAETSVPVRSRPSVYFVSGLDPGLFFVTTQGHVVSVGLDGTPRWNVQPDPSATNCSSTPAVTFDGHLFVALNGAAGPRVWKLNAATGAIEQQTPPLGMPDSDSSSLAVASNFVYLGISNPLPGIGSLFVLDTNLIIRSTGIAAGEGVMAPPFVRGQFMYDGTLAGKLYRINSVTSNPDPAFGTGGFAPIGEPMESSLFAVQHPSEPLEIYAGTASGRVYRVEENGAFTLAYDVAEHGPPAPVEGLVVVPTATDYVLAFGAGRLFHEVPLSNPAAALVHPDQGLPDGGFSTAPTYAAASRIFALGNMDGHVYTFPNVFP